MHRPVEYVIGFVLIIVNLDNIAKGSVTDKAGTSLTYRILLDTQNTINYAFPLNFRLTNKLTNLGSQFLST